MIGSDSILAGFLVPTWYFGKIIKKNCISDLNFGMQVEVYFFQEFSLYFCYTDGLKPILRGKRKNEKGNNDVVYSHNGDLVLECLWWWE